MCDSGALPRGSRAFAAAAQTGATLLKWAAYGGHWECVNLLVKNGANINVRDNSGNTPLITACAYGYPEVVLTLLEAGADIEAKSKVPRSSS